MDNSKGTVNIGGSAHDASYRYKMPKLIAKIEGRGNGIKTKIVNMADIAKSLKCNPAYPTKYFGCELGAQSKWTEASAESIVNGAHADKTLAKLLEGFIDRFILCPQCRLPETDLEVKRETLYANCSACGFYDVLDMSHKVTTYIIKNPPVKKKKVKGAAGAVEEKAPKQAAAAAAEEREEELFEAPPPTPARAKGGHDVVWYTDTSDEAVLARQKEGIGANDLLKELSVAHVSRSIGETAAEFSAWLKASPRSVDEIAAQMTELQTTYAHPAIQMLDVFIDSLWDNNMLKDYPKYRPLYKRYIDSEKAQKVVLGNVERFCGESHPAMKKYAGHILKAFYDDDIVSEDAILKWADKKGSKYVSAAAAAAVKTAAKTFIDWLREADEEGSDDDDDEEADDDDEADEAADEDDDSPGSPAAAAPAAPAATKSVSVSVPAPAKAAAPKKAAAAEEEDIDIDDI